MYFKTEGIILLQRNFGEADKLLTIYTKDYGKLTCIAKGVRRPSSKKSGHIELGNWCKIYVVEGKNIDLLTEVEVKKSFGAEDIKGDRANRIYHLLEIVNLLTPNGQANPKVFSLLLNFLFEVARDYDFKSISSIFKVKLLKNLGYFSSEHITSSSMREFLYQMEEGDYSRIKNKFNLTQGAYLKLLAFLDSMIENLTEKKLKTVRFVNAGV